MNSRLELGKVVIETRRKGKVDYLDLLVILLFAGSFLSFFVNFYI